MKITLPIFKDGVPLWNATPVEIDVEDEYIIEINSIDDFKEKIIDTMETKTIDNYNKVIDDIDKMIKKNIILPALQEKRKSFEKRMKLFLIDFDETTKAKYQEQIKNAIELIKTKNNISSNFILENANEIKNIIDEYKYSIIAKLKENRKEANKKYYENKKQKLTIEPKNHLTEENKIENRKQANKKYYESRKESLNIHSRVKLTDEQKKENKKSANKKYREKQLLLKADLNKNNIDGNTEELSPKEKKQLYNQNYYESKKELINKIKQLETDLNALKMKSEN
jgi:hypothetical protein